MNWLLNKTSSMKKIFSVIILFCAIDINAQTHTLTKLWETDSIIAVPESVLPDFKKGILYISLIDGGGWNNDGKGGIGILSIDGKRYDSTWIKGLSAPKGMGILNGKMYAANFNEVVVIDIKKGAIEKRISLDTTLAKGFNDITISDKGIVYVSDSRLGKVWRLEKETLVLYLDSLKGVNGLKAIGDDLFIGVGKKLVKADKNKIITPVAEVSQSIDGIEPVGNGDFIVTAWAGYIYYVSANGNVETLLDTHLEKKNTADIGYDSKNRIVYVPTFNARKIVAYTLK
jgi:hypothetical protein